MLHRSFDSAYFYLFVYQANLRELTGNKALLHRKYLTDLKNPLRFRIKEIQKPYL
jgi:hypothetical protein